MNIHIKAALITFVIVAGLATGGVLAITYPAVFLPSLLVVTILVLIAVLIYTLYLEILIDLERRLE